MNEHQMINKATEISQSSPGITSQGPDGYTALIPKWGAAKWDPATDPPINICGKSINDVRDWLFPHRFTMRGLKELYESKRPFADEKAPTVQEIDVWNIEVINLFRRLLGQDYVMEGAPMLYVRERISTELRRTAVWDTCYPTNLCMPKYPDGATMNPNPHCGMVWKPEDVSCGLPTLEAYKENYCENTPWHHKGPGSEGMFPLDLNLPWAIRVATAIADSFQQDGYEAHTGPLIGRGTCGLSFWYEEKYNESRELIQTFTMTGGWGGEIKGIECTVTGHPGDRPLEARTA
jgi:hypothetical protein